MGAGVSKKWVRIGSRPSPQPPPLQSLDTKQGASIGNIQNPVLTKGSELSEEEDAMLESSRILSGAQSKVSDLLNDASDLMDMQEFSDIPPTLVVSLIPIAGVRSKDHSQLLWPQIRFAIVDVSLPIPTTPILADAYDSEAAGAGHGWDLAYCVATLGTVTRIIESPAPPELLPTAGAPVSAAASAAAAACRLFRAAPAAAFPLHEADEISVLGQVLRMAAVLVTLASILLVSS